MNTIIAILLLLCASLCVAAVAYGVEADMKNDSVDRLSVVGTVAFIVLAVVMTAGAVALLAQR